MPQPTAAHLRRAGPTAARFTAFRTPLFSVHISVSLHGKSYPPPTGFHTFYVVHILITTCWESYACSKIGPAPLDPARSLARYLTAGQRGEELVVVTRLFLLLCECR